MRAPHRRRYTGYRWASRLAERGNHAIAAPFNWSEVHEEHLIVTVINDFAQRMTAADKIGRGELAFEDRVLEMVAEVAHGFVNGPEPLVVADVVVDEVGITHIMLFLYTTS
jgi:hypothetical protein